MGKKFSEKAKIIFANHPNQNTIYFVNSGRAFFDSAIAKEHGERYLNDTSLETHERITPSAQKVLDEEVERLNKLKEEYKELKGNPAHYTWTPDEIEAKIEELKSDKNA